MVYKYGLIIKNMIFKLVGDLMYRAVVISALLLFTLISPSFAFLLFAMFIADYLFPDEE